MRRDVLILFAKLPQAGEVKTRLGRSIGMENAANIYREFAEHAFGIAEELSFMGVETHLCYEPTVDEETIRAWVHRSFSFAPQQGATLGQRMYNAFRKVIEEGAKKAVIIGTDVPELQSTNVAEAFASLDENDIVVGPSADGGYYLLGMKAPLKELFDGIQWSTDTVFKATIARITDLKLSSAVLPVLHDIDTEEDLRQHEQRLQRNIR